MSRLKLRMAAAVLAAAALGGCTSDGTSLFEKEFWSDAPFVVGEDADDKGIAALVKGDFATARKHFERALRADEDNVYALVGLAMVLQSTGEPAKARLLYERALELDPSQDAEMLTFGAMMPQPVAEVAAVNLAMLGGDPRRRGAYSLDGQGGAPTPESPMFGARPMTPQGTATAPGSMAATVGDANVLQRFEILKALLDQGLVTPDEFRARRKANLGALLPLSAPPPAAGLERVVPPADEIAARLRAIGRSLEMRAMSPGQHAAERSMILDGVLPASPVMVAAPTPPPSGVMEAAAAARRLETLRQRGLITADEFAKERAAIEAAVQGDPARLAQPGAASPRGVPASRDTPPPPPPASMATSGPGVHLASYRSRAAADKGWGEISRKFRALLGGLSPEIARVDLGPGKGVYYRLKAGPLPSQSEARRLCSRLKARRQYCEPTFVGS